jgi:PAS domain S-box-containing protein
MKSNGMLFASTAFILSMPKQPDGIWIIDSDARTLYANAAMAEILGTSAPALIGQPSFDYLFPEDVEAAERLFDAKQRGDANPFHFKLRRKDGSSIWVDVQGTPMRNAAGEFIGIVGTFSVSAQQGTE